ncbi:MAG: CcmD family protein [Sphingomonadales bacterium]|nr:CcmD family protein [Sphingomonadales bacterium]
MKNLFSRSTLLVLLLTLSAVSFGQNASSSMDNVMRSNGQIYVVIAVMLTILIGLLLYLVRLDKKISKMEKR